MPYSDIVMGTEQTLKQDWFHCFYSTVFLVVLQEILLLQLGRSWLGQCFQLTEHRASQRSLRMKSTVWSDHLLSASSNQALPPLLRLQCFQVKLREQMQAALSHSKPFQVQGISLNLLIQNNQWMTGLHAFTESVPGRGRKQRDFPKL